jgi:hypothetical protein
MLTGGENMLTSERTVLKDFRTLRSQLRLIQGRYNAKDENLHFACFDHADADLYPQLLSLAVDGLRTVRRHKVYFANHPFFSDGLFWYDLFLAISAAAHRVRADKAQRYIPEALVNKLIIVLVQIARYTTVEDGDITKRNYEALGNTLLAFYTNDRIQVVRQQARTLPAQAKRLVNDAIRRVKELRTVEGNGQGTLVTSNAEGTA